MVRGETEKRKRLSVLWTSHFHAWRLIQAGTVLQAVFNRARAHDFRIAPPVEGVDRWMVFFLLQHAFCLSMVRKVAIVNVCPKRPDIREVRDG